MQITLKQNDFQFPKQPLLNLFNYRISFNKENKCNLNKTNVNKFKNQYQKSTYSLTASL